jgi:hypothetical protein
MDSDAAKPTPAKASALLILPGELKNMITDYYLYEPNGLDYQYQPNDTTFRLHRRQARLTSSRVPSPDAGASSPAPASEVNQLKFVCRQFYDETRGRALRLNELVFTHRGNPQPNALMQSNRFLYACSPENRRRLRNVTLLSEPHIRDSLQVCMFDELRGSQLGTTVDFCKSLPKMSVRFELNYLDLWGPHDYTFQRAYWIPKHWREKDIVWPFTGAMLNEFNRGVGWISPLCVTLPDNIRFYPRTHANPIDIEERLQEWEENMTDETRVVWREELRQVAHFEATKPTSRVTQLAQGGTEFLRQLTPPRFVFAPTSLPHSPRTMNSETI